MKIVVDARTMGSKPSGVGIYAFNYLKELVKTEYKLILLTDIAASEEIKYMQSQDVEIIPYGTKVYRSVQVFRYFDFVREQLIKIQPELFWEPNILIPKKLTGYHGKVMITIHDMFPVTHMRYFGWKYGLYFRIMLLKTIKRVDIVTYNSLETKMESERFFQKLKEKKNYILYVIVPRTEVAAESQRTTVLESVKNKDYFLYVGNMEKRKGVDLLLDSYEQYRKQGGTKALVLAGKKREQDVDKKTASLVEKYNDVIYFGYVSDEDKQALYQNCACFLFPSMAEGFGICVLEAMNYYKPIIASDLSIFKEVVGKDICYFSLKGNREQQVANLSQKMFAFNTAIDKNVYDVIMERYTPERLGRQMQDILEEL